VSILRDRRPRAGWVLAALAVVFAVGTATDVGADPLEGSQGTDTSLPATESAVTISGRGQFSNLSITVNQTTKLTNQAISISWTGGTPTTRGAGRFDANFLQIMQCWGDDDGTVQGNPGPPPEQCEFGAAGGTVNGISTGLFAEGATVSRIIARDSWPVHDKTIGHYDPLSGNIWRPFHSVDGAVVNVQTDPEYNPFLGGNYWLNPFFNFITTNEVPGAVTGPDGKGAELFQVLTGAESSGLGCGKKVEPVAGADPKEPKCWLVIVPRGDQLTENANTPFSAFGTTRPVSTSPLSDAAWANRIAIPLAFNPADPACGLGAVERRIAGSELLTPAIASWQPALCGAGALPPFSFAPVADGTARSLLTSGVQGSPGMIAVSRPIAGPSVNADNPIVYSPISASGLAIGFNVERGEKIGASEASKQLLGVRVARMNLTPRLVAKLLTQSYATQVSILSTSVYPWASTNPANLSLDPDFLQFNPEFNLLYVAEGRTFSGLQIPAGNSDAATQIWEWIFADPEASEWMTGSPDQWGMTVNPAYNSVASKNTSGIGFGEPLPSSFPKADPFCYQAPNQGPGNSIKPPLVCGTDWMPYARSFASAAQVARTANDGARISANIFAEAPSAVWGRSGPQGIGTRAMLALTDTPSAAQYGLQVASLSRAGDNGPGRSFIAPDAAGLAAGLGSMVARDVPEVLEPSPAAVAPGAYPLTAVTYAAILPLSLEADERSDYAAFLDYATGAGQAAGLDLGQLPRGYVPLPSALQSQAAAAADTVRTIAAAPPSTTTTTVVTQPTRTPTATTPRPISTPVTATTVATGTTVPPQTSVDAATTTTVPADGAGTPVATASPVITPVTKLTRNRFVVPGLGVMAMVSALGVLEITKRPRRGTPSLAQGTIQIESE
jgi:hypothetical protein